jgi:phosphatidylserine decarboxylase
MIVNDAYRFIIPLLAIAVLCAYFHITWAACTLVFIAVLVCLFFRNPSREIPQGASLIVSPADGKVVKVSGIAAAEGEPKTQGISIFLSVFDVHVTRAPVDGELEKLEYRRGRFRAAFRDEASFVNEQNILTIRRGDRLVTVRQIAGLIARRVVCWKQPGAFLKRGEVFGLIRFGSRVDVTLPAEAKIHVRVGDRVKGGSSIIGALE